MQSQPSQESVRRLQAFVSRVEFIERYSFFDGGSDIAGCTIREVNGHTVVEFHGPSDEATDALLLHIRVLTARDDVAIGRMAELYEDPGVSQTWKDEHAHWRDILNRRLDGVHAWGHKGTLSYRGVFEMILHGNRGHELASDKAYKQYRYWVTNAFEQQMLKDTFFQVVIWICAVAHNIAVASRKELARAAAQVPSPT